MDGFKFHELRHTAGALAAQTGATTKELMARLGHSSTRAAMIYQHSSAERDRRIAERLGAMVDQGRRRVREATPNVPSRAGPACPLDQDPTDGGSAPAEPSGRDH